MDENPHNVSAEKRSADLQIQPTAIPIIKIMKYDLGVFFNEIFISIIHFLNIKY